MNVRLESMSHGDGKVYLQMVLDRIQDDAAVLLEARLKSGIEVPAHLFPFHPTETTSQANYVVVLPHLDVREVDLTFFEFSGEGAPLSQSHLTIELNMVRWKTRFNAIVHNELNAQMFDVEREYCADRMNIYFTDVVDDGDEIVVRMLVDMPHVEGADVMVDFSDLTGNEVDLAVYPLLDEVIPPERLGDEGRLHLGFSVRVRAGAKDFCVTVYDANELVAGGFALFCDETYYPLRESFVYFATDAEHDSRYGEWHQRHCATLAELAQQKRASLPHTPQISLVLPVFPGDECYLPATLKALLQQSYTNFELVLADGGLAEYSLASALREWEGDARLMHIVLGEGCDEATARLTGIMQSSGEACAVLDPRIILAPEALYEFALRINEVAQSNPQGFGVIYANHDYFDREEGLHAPVFKPVLSPDLLYSYDYMGPFVMFSRRIVTEVSEGEGFTTEAFEYDLALKAVARTKSVERIDAVLYHVQDAACISPTADKIRSRREEESFRGGRKAVANALRRAHIEATVLSDVAARRYRIQYRLPAKAPSFSVAVIGSGDAEKVRICIESLHATDARRDYDVVVADSYGEETGIRLLCETMTSQQSSVRYLPVKASNRAALANAAVSACPGEFVLLLDADTEFLSEDSISILLAHCARSGVAAVGAKLLFSDDTVNQAGMMVGTREGAEPIGTYLPRYALGYQRRLLCSQNLSAVSDAAVMLRKAAFKEAGGFDDRFSMGLHDADLCLRLIKAGYLIAYNGDVEVYHQTMHPSPSALSRAQRLRMEKEHAFFCYRWPQYFIDGDPFMSVCFDGDMPYYHLGSAD